MVKCNSLCDAVLEGNLDESLEVAVELDADLKRAASATSGMWKIKAGILVRFVLENTEQSRMEAWHLADSYRRRVAEGADDPEAEKSA